MEMSLLQQLFEMRGSGDDVVPHPGEDGEQNGVLVVDVHRLGGYEEEELGHGNFHERRLFDHALEIPSKEQNREKVGIGIQIFQFGLFSCEVTTPG